MFKDLVLKNRSYRRFDEGQAVAMETLLKLVDLARLTPSAQNAQPLKYILSVDPQTNARIFPTLAWAGYLRDWPGPQEGERPSAYIVMLGDTEVRPSFGCDHGIAAQTILLGAVEQGLGGCMIGSIHKENLRAALSIGVRYEILLVIALGKPVETVVVETVDESGNIKYWRDAQQVHHVPKRALSEIVLEQHA